MNKPNTMKTALRNLAAGLAALLTVGLIAAGCGGDDSTTSSSSAKQTVDSAVSTCTDSAQDIGGSAGTAVEGACKAAGSSFQSDLDAAGGDVDKAVSKASKSCNQAAGKLPSGDAQDTVSSLCDAIDSAGS